MGRTLNLKNLYAKKFSTFAFTGIWKTVMGLPETCGIWIIYGIEKNGKTWFCLMLAEYLSQFARVLYVSAEEGMGKDFVAAVKRAKLDPENNALQFSEYLTVTELEDKLTKRNAPKVVFIDNITVFQEELKYGKLRKLKDAFPKVLFVYVAHEDENKKGAPYTATAKLAKKLAKVIVHVQGLACFVSGRVPGGVMSINEEKAMLYHGMQELNND
ncbi:hypothetical protein BFP77_08195 [Maribacter sp. 4U21]|uniref:hypothetical protein n=1 Tax=Maribacter sp. 4U21 TaxID=1889779 RepID=UPI000C15881F|nr:hypothetical protein [Maribacter sp. 4U21]PIB28887.1 hypothetical protein BFP77_08195 [Maribacter sp. 4U21]